LYSTDSVALAFSNWKTKFYQAPRIVRPSTEPGADLAAKGLLRVFTS
jgi:hypothetical protein